MPPGKLGKSVILPAEDFGYQFLVGFGAQSPPCPSTRRATQHNCLLIRTVPPTVTRFFADFPPPSGDASDHRIRELNRLGQTNPKPYGFGGPVSIKGRQRMRAGLAWLTFPVCAFGYSGQLTRDKIEFLGSFLYRDRAKRGASILLILGSRRSRYLIAVVVSRP